MVDAASFEFLKGHIVSVTFRDGTERDIDLEKYLRGPIFQKIRNHQKHFHALTIDMGALTWPNGADICPDVLFYDLPLAGRPMTRRAALRLKRWLSAGTSSDHIEQEINLRRSPNPGMSWFMGITITLKYRSGAIPRFRATYSGTRAVFSIDTLRVLEGELSRRATDLVREWASLHQRELRANWARARRRLPLKPIAPLD